MLLIKFFRFSLADKRMILETIVLLFISRMTIIILPYRFLKPMLGKYKKESNTPSSADIKVIKRVAYWIKRISPMLLWKCNCLPQAITGRFMLKFRNIDSTIYLDEQR